MKVIKRNGDRVEFSPIKIQKAIETANDSVEPSYKKITKTLIAQITAEIADEYISKNRTKSVEYIADQVEKKLIDYNAYETAKEYITYRYLHKLARNKYDDLMDAIESKLNARDVQNQNANLDERSFGGRTGEMANMINKQFALDYLLSDMARDNHINNMIYTHDLDSYAVGSHNCMSIPFDDLLANGFKTKQTDVRPAGSVNTAFQLVAVIFQLQSLQQFGGVSATHLDWTMVPYVRMSFLKHYNTLREFASALPLVKTRPEIKLDNVRVVSIDDKLIYKHKNIIDKIIYKFALKLTEKEVHQAVEGMYHNLNTLQSRSGNQLPFTSINYGTCTYLEGRMVTNAILDVSFEGLGSKHRTSIFPCGIFQCMTGVNRKKGDPNYDLFRKALKSTSQRLYPNYANVDWSGNVSAIEYDRNLKQQVLDTLSETEKLELINKLEQYPELQDILNIQIIETSED